MLPFVLLTRWISAKTTAVAPPSNLFTPLFAMSCLLLLPSLLLWIWQGSLRHWNETEHEKTFSLSLMHHHQRHFDITQLYILRVFFFFFNCFHLHPCKSFIRLFWLCCLSRAPRLRVDVWTSWRNFFLDWSDDVITDVCSTIVPLKKAQTAAETVFELVITRNNNRSGVIHLSIHLLT